MDRSLYLDFAKTNSAVVAEQAREVRALYPELFAALDQRDRQIRRLVDRIAFLDDPESYVPMQYLEQELRSLHTLRAGIGDLCSFDR